jgi:hypothetical protein
MESKIKIFITLILTYAFFTNTYLTTNDASRFSLTASIAEEHILEIENYLDEVIAEWWWAKDFAAFGGHLYSDKAPLGSFLGVPIYLLISTFIDDFGILAYFVTLSTAGLLTATSALLIFEMGKYFETKENIKVTLALTYGLGTIAFFYYNLFCFLSFLSSLPS